MRNLKSSSYTINDVDSRQLEELGAVSRICGRYFDINGIMCSAGVNDRIVAIDMEDLKKTPLVIGIASDMINVPSVLSCLRSGYINALIIDEALARCIVAEMKAEKNKL